MTPYLRRAYLQEIAELTANLRDDPDWEELRRVLRRRRIRPASALLVAFIEDGDGSEHGVLVTSDSRVVEYHRRTASPHRRPRVLAWRDRTADAVVAAEYPQVAVALEMRDAGAGS
jgi:hypothetical protein